MNTSKEIEEVGGGGGGGEKTKQNQVNGNRTGKSCIGSLYYTYNLPPHISKGFHNPRCIGISRTLKQVPSHIVEQSEASTEGQHLLNFVYECHGYSVYVNAEDSSTLKPGAKPKLPVCKGFWKLLGGIDPNANTASAPAHAHTKEDGRELPQPQMFRPTHYSRDDSMSRFTRNANVVASGVARDMRRVGNYVKESLEEVLYPNRRRPK